LHDKIAYSQHLQGANMEIEHIALNVKDPVAMAKWYSDHLGMKVVRAVAGAPHTHFLADEAGRVVLELYHQERAPIPDYLKMDPVTLHIAFKSKNMEAEQAKLIASGATLATGPVTTPTGDTLTMLRDPWGICIQLVKRTAPLL
jgi:glyoxylase I family protein